VSEGIPDHFWREIEAKYAESSGLTLASAEAADPNLHLPSTSAGTKRSSSKGREGPLSRKKKAVTYVDEITTDNNIGEEFDREREEEGAEEEEAEEEEEERNGQRKLVKKLLMAPPPPPPTPAVAPGTSGKKTTKR